MDDNAMDDNVMDDNPMDGNLMDGTKAPSGGDTAAQGRYFDALFAGRPLLGILRGFTPEETVARAERAWDLGIEAIEVPVETPERLPALVAAVSAGKRRGKGVGAGTVCTAEQVLMVREAGAVFTVAPGYDRDTAVASLAAGLPHLPGVATPGEIQAAVRAGHTWVKLFPARALGSDYLRSLRGPFPRVGLVATGGMDAHNAAEYLDAGADVVAVGSALADPHQLDLLADLMARRGGTGR